MGGEWGWVQDVDSDREEKTSGMWKVNVLLFIRIPVCLKKPGVCTQVRTYFELDDVKLQEVRRQKVI